MSISFYHSLHLIALLTMISALTVLLLSPERSKIANIIFGISSLVIAIAGFGMIAKLGYSMASVWIIGKLLIWFVLAMGIPWASKRIPHAKRMILLSSMGLVFIAVILAVIKPY